MNRALIAIVLLAALTAASAKPLEFKGLQFNETADEAREKLGVDWTCEDETDYGVRTCSTFSLGGMTYAGIPMQHLSASFFAGRLYSITAQLISRAGDSQVIAAVSGVHGKPSKSSHDMKSSRGVPHKIFVSKWKADAGGEIQLLDYEPPTDILLVQAESAVRENVRRAIIKKQVKAKTDI